MYGKDLQKRWLGEYITGGRGRLRKNCDENYQ